MSTCSIVGEYVSYPHFGGRYVHADGYPSGVGQTLFNEYQRAFKGRAASLLNILLAERIGWSQLDRCDLTLDSVWPSDASRAPVSYSARGDVSELIHGEYRVSDSEGPNSDIRYGYVISPRTATLDVWKNGAAGWLLLASVNLDGPAPVWSALDSATLSGLELVPNATSRALLTEVRLAPKEKSKFVSAVDTAKLVREALKAAYPGFKFSVTSKHHDSIRVSWLDGPLESEVKALVGHFHGASFDGMQDLTIYHDSRSAAGELVHYGNRFLFTERGYTAASMTALAAEIAERCGVTAPGYTDGKYGVQTVGAWSPEKDSNGNYYDRHVMKLAQNKNFWQGGARLLRSSALKVGMTVQNAGADNESVGPNPADTLTVRSIKAMEHDGLPDGYCIEFEGASDEANNYWYYGDDRQSDDLRWRLVDASQEAPKAAVSTTVPRCADSDHKYVATKDGKFGVGGDAIEYLRCSVCDHIKFYDEELSADEDYIPTTHPERVQTARRDPVVQQARALLDSISEPLDLPEDVQDWDALADAHASELEKAEERRLDNLADERDAADYLAEHGREAPTQESVYTVETVYSDLRKVEPRDMFPMWYTDQHGNTYTVENVTLGNPARDGMYILHTTEARLGHYMDRNSTLHAVFGDAVLFESDPRAERKALSTVLALEAHNGAVTAQSGGPRLTNAEKASLIQQCQALTPRCVAPAVFDRMNAIQQAETGAGLLLAELFKGDAAALLRVVEVALRDVNASGEAEVIGLLLEDLGK